MKALIICSVHALCNVSQLEREAFNRACERHGFPSALTIRDHARLLSTTTMLGFLNHFPCSKEQRERLIASYLDILHDDIWDTTLMPYKAVSSDLLGRNGTARPKGFVSDYPLLTTNMVRSAALLTNASKLGHLTTLSDPLHVETTAAGLAACAAAMEVAHHETEVIVAHRRNFIAAQSIGMSPRFVKGSRQNTPSRLEYCELSAQITTGPMNNGIARPQTLALPA